MRSMRRRRQRQFSPFDYKISSRLMVGLLTYKVLQSHWFSINFRQRKWRISRFSRCCNRCCFGCCWTLGLVHIVDIIRIRIIYWMSVGVIYRRWTSNVFRNVIYILYCVLFAHRAHVGNYWRFLSIFLPRSIYPFKVSFYVIESFGYSANVRF